MTCTYWLPGGHRRCGAEAYAVVGDGARCQDHAVALLADLAAYTNEDKTAVLVDKELLKRLGYKELRR